MKYTREDVMEVRADCRIVKFKLKCANEIIAKQRVDFLRELILL